MSISGWHATRWSATAFMTRPRAAKSVVAGQVDEVVAHAGDVHRGGLGRAGRSRASVMRQTMPRPSSGEVAARDEPGLLHPRDGVRDPAAAVRERVGELGHPHLPAVALGEAHQDLVLRQREVERAPQVVVEPVQEQGDAQDEGPPGPLLARRRASGSRVRRSCAPP